MGFALPTFSTLAFFRLAQGIRLPAVAKEPASNAAQMAQGRGAATPACLLPPPASAHQGPPVAASKARGHARRRAKTPRKAEHDGAQMNLPLQAANETMASPNLRIVQRAPHEQPECMFISGRMADVCAALERMEACADRLND